MDANTQAIVDAISHGFTVFTWVYAFFQTVCFILSLIAVLGRDSK